jgi:glycosyltransferase involved in cell wall biosynthesis
MKIAVVAPPWLAVPPPAYGGTEAVVDVLASGLAALGHDVLLICHPDSTCAVERRSVVPAADAVPMGRASIELEHAIGGYRLAAAAGVDVVSDHTIGGVVHSAAHPELAVVATNHNPFSRTRQSIYSTLAGRGAIVAISLSHARSTSLPVAAVIHHGLDVDTFPAGDGSGGYLAMLTRMSPDKGIEQAISIARAAGVALRIAAKVSAGLEQAYFDDCVRPRLGGGIEFLGEVDATGKRELLAGALALLNPIQWDEPFGMAMLESLACGTPVIATPRGAAPEIIDTGHNGILAAEEPALVAAVGEVSAISREACRASARQRFSIEVMCRKYVDAFEAEQARRRATPA